MARKYNLDKVSNYLLTETTLSADETQKVLDVVEEQFSQNIREQKKRRIVPKITKRCKTYENGRRKSHS